MTRAILFSLALLVLGANPVLTQELAPADKSTSIPFVEQAPVLDGVLDDAIWEQAVVIDDLHQVKPTEYAAPTQRTELLPAHLLQAQRDYFGAHTYERLDGPRGESFHTNWTGRGGTTASTTYNA